MQLGLDPVRHEQNPSQEYHYFSEGSLLSVIIQCSWYWDMPKELQFVHFKFLG